MDDARRIVLLECGMGALWAGYGLVLESPATVRRAWWLVAAAAAVTAVLMYGQDHVIVGWNAMQQGAAAIASVLVGVAVFGVIVAVTDLTVGTIVSVSIGGIGAGLLGYRLVYGVVLPVPQTRLEKVRERTV